MLPVLEWWDNLQQRYTGTRVQFSEACQHDSAQRIDSEVWDSVVDNLLQNALAKAQHEPEVMIQAQLNIDGEIYIEVSDSGSPMPEEVANSLFRKRIRSEGGLGIGLYQAGRQAQQAGYRLGLHENRSGAVSFRLATKPAE